METDRKLSTDARRGSARRRRGLPKWIGLLTLLLIASVTVSCGQRVVPYWPGLAVADGVVYVVHGPDPSGQLFALDAETGNTLWSYPLVEQGSGGLLGCSGPKAADGPFHSAPAIGEQLIYLGSAGEQTRSLFSKGENMSGLRALNKSGVLQWEYRGTQDRAVAPPALGGGAVYLSSSDHSVHAIDRETHQAEWVFETGNWVWASPVVPGDLVFVASMDHSLYAVDTATGNQVWRFDEPTSALPGAPDTAEGVLYFGALDGHVYAVEAQTGDLVWKRQLDGGVWGSPLVAGDSVYLGTLGGNVYALDTADGTVRWQKEVEGDIRSAPAHVDGLIYIGSEAGRLHAFDAADGSERVSPLGQQLDKASIHTTPVYDGQRLYVVSTDGQVFALDLERNATVWSVNPLARDQEK